jgi:tRNA nucleotidyltransferase/poly(A) polymerase
VKHTVDNFLLYYLNSIDSVYLTGDGKLHDPTGFGFEDAQTKTLRINDYD